MKVEIEFPEFNRLKTHMQKHKTAYLIGAGIGIAGITFIIVRGIVSQPIRVGITSDAANGGIASVVGKKVEMHNVSYIFANRQGSPSWVVRCIETDEIFTSQRAAALAHDIPQSELSQHLNGLRNAVRNLHYERICMAA